MKKLLSFILLAIGTSILISSCSQLPTLTIEKRHFNNGYYIDYGSTIKKTDANQSVKEDKAEQPVLASVQQPSPDKASIKAALSKNGLENMEETFAGNDKSVANNIKETNTTSTKRPLGFVSKMASSAKTLVNNPRDIKNLISEKKISARHDNGSLVWTIIAILIILILLDILTGGWLGALLWLVIVIVLIILLLRLLGII